MLSDKSLALLRASLTGRNPEVDDTTRAAYQELVAAGLMIPLHTIAKGRETAYRLTESGVSFFSTPAPSREESLSLGG
jgi:hypothetical protein